MGSRAGLGLYIRFLGVAVCALAVSACAVTKPVDPEEAWDPIEPVNRGIFWFNDKADTYVIEPASDVYDFILPDRVQNGVGNFFDNLKGPVRVVNSLLQLKGTQAVEQFSRFCINSTAGLLGIFDVATEWGIKKEEEDLGVTLATYGMPAGPYLVLPFMGPSNLRDGIGRVGDGFLDPVFYTGAVIDHDQTAMAVSAGLKGLDILQTRYELDPAIETSRKSSLDRYLFVQSAYYQIRNGRIHDGHLPSKPRLSMPTSEPGAEGAEEEGDISFDD